MKTRTAENKSTPNSSSSYFLQQTKDAPFFSLNSKTVLPFFTPSKTAPESSTKPKIIIQQGLSPTIQTRRSATQGNQAESFVPSTTKGILNGEYQPGTADSNGILTVTLKLHMHFIPQVQPGSDQSSQRVGWTPLQQDAYRSNYQHLIEEGWSHKYLIQERRGSRREVGVNLRIIYVPQGQADWSITVFRSPGDQRNRDFVIPPAGSGMIDTQTGQLTGRPRSAAIAYDEGLRSTPDTNTISRTQLQANATIHFDSNSSTLSAFLNADDPLPRFRDSLRAEMRDGRSQNIQVEIRGFANGDTRLSQGNQGRLSLQRAIAVRQELSRLLHDSRVQLLVIPMGGIESGQIEDRRKVEVLARRSGSQRTAIHEAGHLIGLGDEYVEPDRDGQASGDEAAHSGLAQRLGMAPVLVGDNPNSIMARGNQISAQHYVTFVELLAAITRTSVESWVINSN